MFHQVWYQGGVKATVSGVVEDLKFKISEGSDQNWCFPDSGQLAVSVSHLDTKLGETPNVGMFHVSRYACLTYVSKGKC